MVLVRERDDRLAMSHVKAVWHRNQAAVRLMRERADAASYAVPAKITLKG
jgi:hypothetical protein